MTKAKENGNKTAEEETTAEETSKEKPVPKGKITLQNYAIKKDIPDMTFAGFKAYLESDSEEELKELHTETKLDKSYEEYLEKPAFIKIKEE